MSELTPEQRQRLGVGVERTPEPPGRAGVAKALGISEIELEVWRKVHSWEDAQARLALLRDVERERQLRTLREWLEALDDDE